MNMHVLVSACSICCLLASSVFGGQPASARSADDVIDTSSLISRSSGKITDSLLTHSSRIVINIQDLHGHPEVQKNIARILADLDKRFLLKNVYVEGGCGAIDTSWLCSINDDALRTDIVENLVDQGLLTGSEYYSVLSKRRLLLQGIEDDAVHKENIARLGAILARQPAIERKLTELEADLILMKARHFSRKSRRFDAIATRFKKGALPPEKYYGQLAGYARELQSDPGRSTDAISLDPARYPNITRYCTAARAVRHMNHAKAAREFTQFTRVLKSLVPYGEYQSLLGAAGHGADWTLLAERCLAVASRYHIALQRFPHLQEFFSWTTVNGRINPIQLIQEEATLERRIREALARGQDEADVAFLATYFPAFQDFLLRRMTAEQYSHVIEHRAAFQAVWASHARFSSVEDLKADQDLVSAFHAANVHRNALFLRHLPLRDGRNAAVSREMPSAPRHEAVVSKPEAVVIVTGGFHSDGLKSLLQERGISFLLITPSVTTETSSAGQRYAARALQQAARFSSHAMQLALASQASAQDRFNFCISAAKKHLRDIPFTRPNINELVTQLRDILGNEQLKVSVDEAEETATFEFADGKTVTLRRNDFTDTIAPTGEFVPGATQTKTMTKTALRHLAAVLKTELITTEALVGLVPMISNTADVFERLAAFAVRHDLFYGNGYTRELKNDEHLRAYINERLGMVAALLPGHAQDIAATRAQRELRIEAGSHTQLLQAVLAVDMLHDFLISIDAAARKPVPLLLETDIGWTNFEEREIVSIPLCPVCGSHDSAPVGTVVINRKSLELGRCRTCEMIWYRTRPPVSFYEKLYGPEYFGYDGQGFEPHGKTSTFDVGIRKHPNISNIAKTGIEQWKQFMTAEGPPETPLKGRRIVEAGPGGGHLLIEAKRQGADVLGVDISEFIVEQLKNNGIDGVVGELQSAGIALNSVDGLAAYDLVEHVFDLDLFLNTAFGILKPGGFLFIRTPDTNDNVPYLHLIDHVLHFSQQTLTKSLERHGFTVVYAQPSGTFEGPDGKMIDNVTVFAQKPATGQSVARPSLPENGTPAPDPLNNRMPQGSLLRDTVPDADALEALLSAA